MKIVVIEDNKADQRLLKEAFRDLNMPAFELVFQNNLTEAMDYIRKEEIGLIILDLGLPECQGIETFLRLKPYTEHIPVVVLTGLGDDEVARTTINNGAQDYLIKGQITNDILKRSLLYAIERQRLVEEMRQYTREIQNKEERFRILIEENADAMVVLSKTEGVQYQNPAAELLFEGASADYLKIPSLSQFEGGTSIERTLDFSSGIQKFIEIRGVLIEWERLPAFLLTIREITERKKAEEVLRETSEFLGKMIDYASAPIMVWDPRFLITRFNEAFEHLTGRTEQEVLGQPLDILFPEESRDTSLALIKKTLEGERWESVKIPILAADGTIHTLLWNSANILTADLELVSTIAQGIDITQSERAEEALRESENRYRSVVEDQTEFICRFAPDGTLTFVNDAYCRYFGLKREECIGKRHSVVLPPDDVSLMKKHIRSLTLKNPVGFIEHRIIMPSGDARWERWSDRAIFDKDGHVVEYQSVGKDITERKRAEEEIRFLNQTLEQRVIERTQQLNALLKEKDILLREIHHRVKNNLQIITSLLNLQSRYVKDEPTLAAIRESQNRIKAMALVHEKLYQAENIAQINLDDYTRFLGTGLIQFYGVKSRRITFTTDIGDINVDINMAIPLGLIINELISNSLKYAFPDREKGEIFVSVLKENHTLSVLVKDDGIGIPADLDWRNTESLGLRLVISLVEQLDGTIELNRTGGTAFTIVVKEKE
jgi:PAS domain S-box-containing protein